MRPSVIVYNQSSSLLFHQFYPETTARELIRILEEWIKRKGGEKSL